MAEEDNPSFHYTYSAKQQEEVKRIRQKYLPPTEDKMAQLRRLDKSAERKGTLIAIGVGLLSTLLFGVGMCCTILWTAYFAVGVVIGVLGLGGIALAYPLFVKITRQQRQKIAPEILALTDELQQPHMGRDNSL